MKKLLEQHGIETKTVNGVLWAFDHVWHAKYKMDCSTWVNTSGWQTYDALNFLGY